jgi:hypothetical protein
MLATNGIDAVANNEHPLNAAESKLVRDGKFTEGNLLQF